MPVLRTLLGAFAALFILALVPAVGLTQPEVEYTVYFDATWSEDTHPIDFPGNPHFSGLIGGTHSDAVSFWELGELASPGIESMAETGSKTLLQGEVQSAIDAGTAGAIISGNGIPVSPGSVSKTFTIIESHPRVTLVSMLAPSPDWFVGVRSLNLREGGQWLPVVVVDMVLYDAGTDSGTMYSSPNQPTLPPIPIYEKTEVPFAENNIVGTFTFQLTTTDAPGTQNASRLGIRSVGANPTRSASRFELRTPDNVSADLHIYDTRGRLVRTLLSGERVNGSIVAWDGRDRHGKRAPTGVYFATVSAGRETRSTKLVLLR